MDGIYAASITLAQSSLGLSVAATLCYTEEERRYMMTLEWPRSASVNAEGNVGEWLYAALHRLIQEYDNHNVVNAVVEPFEILK